MLALRVGVSGHPNLPPACSEAIDARVREALEHLRELVHEVERGEALSDDEPVLHLVSALARGADQRVARIALEQGYGLNAVLPFGRELYENGPDFPDGDERRALQDLLAKAGSHVVELDGEPGDHTALREYLVEHSDVLVAVWDDAPGADDGGTHDVLELALRSKVPVLHVPVTGGEVGAVELLCEDLDGPRRKLEDLDAKRLGLLPPVNDPESSEADLCDHYFRELEGRRLRTWASKHATRLWEGWLWLMKPGPLPPQGLEPPERARASFEGWLARHERADELANLYTGLYRCSFLVNFTLGAVAVLLAVLGKLTGDEHHVLGGSEAVALAAIFFIHRYSRKRRWRQRATDYRLLSELLRTACHLAPLSHTLTAAPSPAHMSEGDVRGTWMYWLTRAYAREAGLVGLEFGDGYREEVRKWLSKAWIGNQSAWHRNTHERYRDIGHKVHEWVVFLFCLTAFGCGLHLLVSLSGTLVLTAAVPAFAGALHAIAIQAEFDRLARRSLHMYRHLQGTVLPVRSSRAALVRCSDAVARSMVAEVADWRSLHGIYATPLP